MTKKFVLSRTMFENLVKHLVDIEDGKSKLFEKYFLEPSKERNEYEEIFDNYITKIDRIIRSTTVTDDAENCIPFSIIGSEVEVKDTESHETFRFRIVPPFQENVGSTDVSCLSPVGKSLLLKKVGEKAVVNAPAGVFCYQIKSINLPMQ